MRAVSRVKRVDQLITLGTSAKFQFPAQESHQTRRNAVYSRPSCIHAIVQNQVVTQEAEARINQYACIGRLTCDATPTINCTYINIRATSTRHLVDISCYLFVYVCLCVFSFFLPLSFYFYKIKIMYQIIYSKKIIASNIIIFYY